MKSNSITNDKLKTDMRKVAISLAEQLPIEGQPFTDKVNEYVKRIMRLPATTRYNLKSAYVFSSKVPREEREDVFQTLFTVLTEAKPTSEKLSYAIARRDWIDWYRQFKVKSQYGMSFELASNSDKENERQLSEVLIGECEFELKMESKLDAQQIWAQLPARMKDIVHKRLLGEDCIRKTGKKGRPYKQYALNGADRKYLHDWIKRNPMSMVSDGIISA